MKKIAGRRNYARVKKYAGRFVGPESNLEDPGHSVHRLSTSELVGFVEQGKPPEWFANKTKADPEIQEMLGIEWDDASSSYVEKGQGTDLGSGVQEMLSKLKEMSSEERQQILMALGDDGPLDAKQAARKRRLNRLTKR